LAGPIGTWVCLTVQNFTSIGIGVGNVAPKISKISTFGKESPCRGEPLDRFLKIWVFYTPNYPASVIKFDLIRFPGYGVIAEKLHVDYLGRIFPCTL